MRQTAHTGIPRRINVDLKTPLLGLNLLKSLEQYKRVGMCICSVKLRIVTAYGLAVL